MFKVINKEIITTSLISFCWIYWVFWALNIEFWAWSIPYFSVYIVNFNQVNVCFKPVSWYSIYTQAERDYCSTVVIANFEHLTCCSVSTVNFEHVFIFWVWSFNISIIFKLRWIQVSLINRKDLLEVKYLHEVAYTNPSLIFFFIYFFKISKLECVSITFLEPPL